MRTVIVGAAPAGHQIIQTIDCDDAFAVRDLEEAAAFVASTDVDAVILLHDVSEHPGLYVLLEDIRANRPTAFVVSDGPTDSRQRVDALDWGVDACLAPPARPEELVATLRALIRSRDARALATTIVAGPLVIDVSARSVRFDGQSLTLRPRDFDILALLARTPGAVVSRSTILDEVWEQGYDGLSNLVDVHVATIRAAMREAGGAHVIETVRGVGYRLVDQHSVTG